MSGSGTNAPTRPTKPPLSTKAVLSAVFGIVSFCGGFITGVPAVVLGFSAKRDIALSGGAERGRGLAWTGIATGTVGIIVSIALLVGLSSGRWLGPQQSSRPWHPPTASDEVDNAALKPFYTQHLQWTDCGAGKCTRVTVPVDYAKPDGATLGLAVKVMPSIGAGGHSLFLNPGGPGASGYRYADYFATKISPAVRERYDLVNVDPRGVGASDHVDCLSARAFTAWAASDPDPDNDREIDELREGNRRFGEGCVKNAGELASHVSTEEAARDFDILRALFGQDKLDWFGFSYGTQLGATYATLFPQRAGRMVLDGPVDPSLSTLDASLAQARGFQQTLTSYVRDCTDDLWCPLGRNEAKAMKRISGLMAKLDQHPMRTDDKNRRLTEGLAFYGIVKPLYSEETWPTLTQALDAALQGDGKVLMRLADSYFRDADGESFRAIVCMDQRDAVTVADVEAALPRFEKASPVFGPALAWGTLGCTDWPVKATSPQVAIDPKTSAPILVVGATRDPATPYSSAKALTRQIPSAVLLTRVGDGHTSYGGGNECIDDAVDAYLIHGRMPARGTVCR